MSQQDGSDSDGPVMGDVVAESGCESDSHSELQLLQAHGPNAVCVLHSAISAILTM